MSWAALLEMQVLAVFALGAVLAWSGWALRQHIRDQMSGKAEGADLRAARHDVETLTGRVAAIETTLRHMPTTEQINSIALRLAEVSGDLRALRSGLEHSEKRLDMIGEHLAGIEDFLRGSRP